ncbi:hypothetical protein A2716_00515 [candidate division WWE3 bacterium RIFCSPHIGHO2_01_FULL_40_23]|uniref:Guanylate cyclase domain-containing protein n=1 Tax=candidate division WWE3 bacterium RIFCSPLOWO2_01_FULL_41_18 TaxID=1802625 RepID=A0A1F4VET6_UNCKA|nr:MAG: hypothetical protein A2716_00515 [candidate division WWE3 bacterium RIFCSPHIGHO2_01_FULL_40_23]OGC55478.1 MAG: hypothetical protein A3A78_00785 [candidate division WWE3 bacterium RIFCSPLOWO2_01_FULL_41_18]
MAKRLIQPSLADLKQDIAGVIPLPLILNWASSKRDVKKHNDLLAPYIIKGTVVSSDSSGLSKLSSQKSLLEVLKLVSEPKEVIFKYGSSTSGKAIGVWAADNTEMFYPEAIPVSKVVESMVEAQTEIASLKVQVGMAVHFGEFYEIGGGLCGDEADFVEEAAESFSGKGEIVISESVKEKLPENNFKLVKKDVKGLKEALYTVISTKPQRVVLRETAGSYPYPFTDSFYKFLKSSKVSELKREDGMYKNLSKNRVITLVRVDHDEKKLLLDFLTDMALGNSIMESVSKEFGIERVKSNGGLGIFASTDVRDSLAFARRIKQVLTFNGYVCSVGMAKGEVLIFPMKEGEEIAGGPVNVASKLAEDVGGRGVIFADSSVTQKPKVKLKGSKFELEVSGVMLKGLKL